MSVMSFVAKPFKWLLVFVLSSIFVTSLLSITITFSFAEATKPENVKPLLLSMLSATMPKGAEQAEMQGRIIEACQNKEEIELPVGGEEGQAIESIKINCNDARSNKSFSELAMEGLFDKIYYADYGCKFTECFKEKREPFFIFSKMSNEFFTDISEKVVIATIIAGILLVLFGGIMIVAKNLITAGLPFFILLLTRKEFMQKLSSSKQFEALMPLITRIDYLSSRIFLVFLITGAVLFVIAFIFRRRAKKAKEVKKAGLKKPKAKKKSRKPKA
jgi:ABC-type multidrug transport system fused ATPase/permease subunit